MQDAAPNLPFFQRPLKTIALTTGDTIQVPVKYWQSKAINAMFWVEYDSIAPLVTGLDVVKFPQNRALVSVAFFTYGKTTIDPYNECGLSVAVAPKGAKVPEFPLPALSLPNTMQTIGQANINLPVSTELACRAGIEVVDFPKFVANIAYERTGNSFTGHVFDPMNPNDKMLTLKGEFGTLTPSVWADLVLLHYRNGRTYRVVTEAAKDQIAYQSTPGTFQLSWSQTSTHPMARNLGLLKFIDTKPFAVNFTDDVYILFNEGVYID
jgi:hypothetical protein